MASVLIPGAGSPPAVTFFEYNASEFLLENPFVKPSVSAFHNVFEGIRAKQQIAFLNKFGKLSVTDAGCGAAPSGTLTPSTKTWDPVFLRAEVEQCASDFYQSFMVWALGNGVNRDDLSQVAYFEGFLYDFLRDAVMEDVMRMAWLSDTALVAGDLTNGAGDLPFYNKFDGFWKQILTSIGVGGANSAKRAITITENAAANAAAQLSLGASVGYNVFKALHEKADSRLISAPNKVIIATRTLVDNYAAYLEDKGNSVAFERIENGFSSLRYRDTQIFSFDLLDRYIQADFLTGSPATYDQPHRAIMTTADNLGIAFDSASALSTISGFYDPKDEDYTAKIKYQLDAKILWDYLVVAAY